MFETKRVTLLSQNATHILGQTSERRDCVSRMEILRNASIDDL